MNLRQQFFWKVLFIVSPIVIIISLYNTYNKYNDAQEAIKVYEENIDDNINQSIQAQTVFIVEKQKKRIDSKPSYELIRNLGVMDLNRAGLKTNPGSDWESKDPIYTAKIGNTCVVEYRNEPKTEYIVGDKIDGTNMVIQSCNQDSIIVYIDSNKGVRERVFYMSKTKKE